MELKIRKNQNIRFSLLIIIISFLYTSHVNSQWALELQRDSILVYSKPSKNNISYYRAETNFNTSIQELYKFLLDFNTYPEWVNNCSQVKLLNSIPDSSYTYYAYFDMPWPARDRDAVSQLSIQKLTTDTIKVSSKSIADLIPEKSFVIRIPQFEEQFLLVKKSENEVFMRMEGAYNPGSYVPDWLMQKMLKYGPYDVMLKIRKLVEKR